MKIIISGGHTRLDYLVRELRSFRHELVVVNSDLQACRTLRKNHKDVAIIHGNPLDLSVLKDVNLRGIELSITLLNSDKDNFSMSMLMKRHFEIPYLMSTVNNPENIEMFEANGIRRILDIPNLLANTIVNAINFKEAAIVVPFPDRNITMMEVPVNSDSSFIGSPVMELKLPEDSTVTCIVKSDASIIFDLDTKLEADDRLVIVARPKMKAKIMKCVQGHEIT